MLKRLYSLLVLKLVYLLQIKLEYLHCTRLV